MMADVLALLSYRVQRNAAAFFSPEEEATASCALPRGAITEISGALSSGRTTLTHALLAHATGAGEFCALVDSADAFDPWSAAAAGVELPRLLWVRTNRKIDAAFKAADLILHSGGFGVIVLDLCEASARDLNRIPLSYWYRFRGAVENTPGKFVVVSHVPLARSCARLPLETRRKSALWLGKKGQTTLSTAPCEHGTNVLPTETESGTDARNARSVPFLFDGIDFTIQDRKQPALKQQARLVG